MSFNKHAYGSDIYPKCKQNRKHVVFLRHCNRVIYQIKFKTNEGKR